MALPLAAGMVAGVTGFISTVSGFFASGGPLLAFFVWIGKKLVAKFAIVSMQFALTTAYFISKSLFLLGVLNVLRLTYNKLRELISSIPASSSSDTSYSLAYNVFQSLGIIDAFIDAFSVFVSLFLPILLIYISKVALQALADIKEDFRKLGMLMMA